MNRFHRWYCRSSHRRRSCKTDFGDHALGVGPGPGMTTDVLARRASKLTAVDIDIEVT